MDELVIGLDADNPHRVTGAQWISIKGRRPDGRVADQRGIVGNDREVMQRV